MSSHNAEGSGSESGTTAPGTHPHAFEALHEIAVAIGAVRDFDDMAGFITGRACALLSADGSVLDIWDERAQLIRAVAAHGTLVGSIPSASRLGQGIAGQTAERREPMVIEDYPNWPYAVPSAVARGVRSAVAAPLLVADRLLGVLIVHFHTPQQFAEHHAQLLALFAAQVAPALRSAELHAEHVSLFERERRLREMSRSLASDLDEAHVIELATRYVSELMDALCVGADGRAVRPPLAG